MTEGTFLMLVNLLLWSNNGYVRKISGYPSSSTSSSTRSHICNQCGVKYSHNGWSTAGGEQFQYSFDPGFDDCCSRSCANNSQYYKWK